MRADTSNKPAKLFGKCPFQHFSDSPRRPFDITKFAPMQIDSIPLFSLPLCLRGCKKIPVDVSISTHTFAAMLARRRRLLTEAEYLLIDDLAPEKSEYFDGEIYSMAGASREHNTLVTNLIVSVSLQLREASLKNCQLFPSDVRVKAKTSYLYPD